MLCLLVVVIFLIVLKMKVLMIIVHMEKSLIRK